MNMRPISILAALLLLLHAPSFAGDQRDADKQGKSILHLLDYVAVEYPGLVQGGKVLNEGEYHEQTEFAGQIRALIGALPDNSSKAALSKLAEDFRRAVLNKSEGAQVVALAAQIRADLIRGYDIQVAPKRPPDKALGAQVYQQYCVACHGANGAGDGPQAKGLDPKPVNFLDGERAGQRSLFSLYNVVSLGVNGTSMAAFSQLSDEQRWAVAFHVGSLAYNKEARERGEKAWEKHSDTTKIFGRLIDVVMLAPNDARTAHGDEAYAVLGYLRSTPSALVAQQPHPIAFSIDTLHSAVEAYKAGRRGEAYDLSVTAYLEGFELVEASIDNLETGLKPRLEQEFMALRNQIKSGAPVTVVENALAALEPKLRDTQGRLQAGNAEGSTDFVGSLIIVLREGVEAILVLAAMAAFLVKTGRRHGLVYLHGGWIAALLLGVITWFVSEKLISISGAQREVTEGVTALISAVMLLYVGFWLHSKTYASRWNAFIKSQVQDAVTGSTLWGIAMVSFIAVYREVFETVLFYQAMWVQAEHIGKVSILSGFASGSALLALLAWALSRYSVRLPLGLFFGFSSVLMAVLAIIFAGKGIAALQAAGKMDAISVAAPTVSALGIFPNMQGLLLQAVLIVLVIGGFAYSHYSATRKSSHA
jgi:high-affinity iron transporter